MEEQKGMLENAETIKGTIETIKQAGQVIKDNQVNMDELYQVKDDMEELKAQNDEITEFFKERGIEEEESVNEELDKLIASVQQEAGAELPDANKEKLEDDKEKEKEGKDENKIVLEA